ncbi:hypothetical protein ACIBO2_56685 [Nonomuraea sp. NPDC050022]
MLAPLYLLTGAPGAGKPTLLPHLIEAADGLIVMEMDELLEQDGTLLGVRIAEPAGGATAYEELLTDQLRVFGPDHPDTQVSHNNLAE